MKIGIIGLPQSGKKTFFRLLTQGANPALEFGICKIKDPRLKLLTALYQPKKTVYGEIECQVLPSIVPGEGSFRPVLEKIKKLDALCLIARDFHSESVFHINSSVDPGRDIRNILTELILSDLALCETRLERIKDEQRRNFSEDRVKEEKTLVKIKNGLEKEVPLYAIEISPDDRKIIDNLSFISGIGLICVVNIDEKDIKNQERKKELSDKFENLKDRILFISAKIESELEGLEEEEKKAFLEDLGITDPAIDYMTRKAAETLNLITFLTAGKDEVRAWLLRKGSNAVVAAGKIHSDIAKGFIRAEIIKYTDLEKLGSEEKVKEKGLFHLKGKDYIFEDGDIVSFRFNI